MPINPGELRHLIQIMKNGNASTVLDAYGRAVIDASTYATVKAKIERLSGNDRALANQEFGTCTHEITCWYIPDVNNRMWVIGLNGKRFNIVDVDNVDEQNHYLRLTVNSESS